MNLFTEQLKKGILVCDGAMGTLLYERGIAFDRGFDEVNLTNPDLVKGIHAEYIEAGADIIETNTFGGNRFRLRQHGLENKHDAINAAGVRIAKQIADAYSEKTERKIFIAGSVGPLGKPIEPIGRIRESDASVWYREQIRVLVQGNVDLIMLETFSDLHELRTAIAAAKQESDLPIVIQMSFTEDGKTLMGNKPQEIVELFTDSSVVAVGANCSVGPQVLLDVLEKMNRRRPGFYAVQPNAGMPRYLGGRYIYLASPEYFGDYAGLFMKNGARIVGGCCGTTPEHIKMIRKAVDRFTPEVTEKKSDYPVILSEIEDVDTVEDTPPNPLHSTLQQKLAEGRFIVSVEVDPPRGMHYEKIIEGVIRCQQNRVDAINIADNPLAKAGMTPLAMANMIRQSVQIETILHMSCRDRNILALQSELMSAYMLGIRNVLCITGDPPVVGDYPDATGVFDIDSIGLIKLISNLNSGVDLAGKSIGSKTEIFTACAVNPTAVDLNKEFDRFEQKIEAGAKVAMTQILYDLSALERFINKFYKRIPVLLGVLPLKNAKHANFMHHEIPDITIPESIRNRMAQAGEKGQETGVDIAREFLTEAKVMVDGVYLIPPFNNFNTAIAVLETL